MNEHDDVTAEALDAFLSARLAGQAQPPSELLSAAEPALASDLIALAQEVRPDPAFAAQLDARLRRHAATQRAERVGSTGSASIPPRRASRQGGVHRRPLAWAAAALLLVSGLLGVPEVRARVLAVLRVGAVRILVTHEMPAATVPPLDGQTTLGGAQRQVDFPIRLPTYPSGLGPPDRVLVQEFRDPLIVLLWFDPNQRDHVRYALYQLANTGLIEKLTGSIQETQVNGRRAFWTRDPHMLRLPAADGAIVRNVESNVLIWTDGEVTYRLETDGTLEEALQIAQSLR